MWYGSELVIVDSFYPSSQLCSNCDHQQKMPLKERVYNCSSCGMNLDRDLNAAINKSKNGRLDRDSLWNECRRRFMLKQEVNITIVCDLLVMHDLNQFYEAANLSTFLALLAVN